MIKISLITVSYNCEHNILKTMKSVLFQNYPNIEYIVIDGGSEDCTYDIVKSMESRFERRNITFIHQSKPDNGIFDAMNKGVKIASGEFVLFLNAGDWLADKDILINIFDNNNIINADVIYGNHYIVEKNGYCYNSYAEITEKISLMMPFSHQAAFTRRTCLLEHPFNIKYSMCADYDLYLYLYLHSANFVKINYFISYFIVGGVSQQNFVKTRKQVFDVRKEQGIVNKYNFIYNYIRMIQYILRFKISEGIGFKQKPNTHPVWFDPELNELN